MHRTRAGVVAVGLSAALVLLAGCTSHVARRVSARVASPAVSAHPSASPSRSPVLRPAAWQIAAGRAGGIEGFANRSGVQAGQPVTLYVSTRAASFAVRAFRMGWYGQVGGAEVWHSAAVRGRQQPPPRLVAPSTHTWAADNWRASITVSTSTWPPGDYLLRLDSSQGGQSYIPLAVRSGSAEGKVVLISADTTWQAYNRWGCCDLYEGADGSRESRSRAVSFDRPYSTGDGSGDFLGTQLGVVAEAERLGIALDYVTDVDLDADPHLLDGARAVVSMGHDEYWSPRMRAAVTAARDAGTNVAFFGANAVYRRIRMAPTLLGPDRLEINYKDASEDPLNGVQDASVTADWRAAPAANPESGLVGAEYACNLGLGNQAAGVVSDPSAWLFQGVQVRAGTRLPGLIGPETNGVQLGYPTPRPLEVVLHSPAQCSSGYSYADTTYYTTLSGAGVFSAGTIAWACAVWGRCSGRVTASTATVVRAVTDNVLRVFAQGPAGRLHLARDNVAALGIGK